MCERAREIYHPNANRLVELITRIFDQIFHIDIAEVNMTEFWNWARTFRCRPRRYAEPTSIESLRTILQEINSTNSKIRVIGCAHSPSALCMSNDVLISMKHFNKILQIDENQREIHCESGLLISTLNEILPQHHLSLPVQGSVSGLTIAGVISTGTHGSGWNFHKE